MLPLHEPSGRQSVAVSWWSSAGVSDSLAPKNDHNEPNSCAFPAGHIRRLPAVLWIDDEVQADDALLRLLAADGIQVDCAQCGADGLALTTIRVYDAIVLDLRLPDMFGLAVLKQFAERNMTTPVLVITGHFLETETEQEAMSAGATAFRYKPLTDAVDLGALLRSMIARSTSDAETGRGPRQTDADPDQDPTFGSAIGQALEALRRTLRHRFPLAADDLLNDAAEDSVLDYLQRPGQFDPARGTTLPGFLLPSAVRNLQNLLQADARRRARESSYVGEQIARSCGEILRDIEQRDLQEHLRRRALAVIVDDRERHALLRWLDGDRSSASLAQALGLSDRRLSEQTREVKRFKDRVLKRLLRASRQGR